MRITCAQCRKNLNVPDSLAGEQSRCPACGSQISIPAEQDSGVPSGPADQLSTSARDGHRRRPGRHGRIATNSVSSGRPKWKAIAAVCAAVVAVAVLTGITCSMSSHTPGLKEVRQAHIALKSYSADCRFTVVTMTGQGGPVGLSDQMKKPVTSTVYGKPPRLMRIVSQMPMLGPSARFIMVFDGTHQWVDFSNEIAGRHINRIMKVRLKDVVSSERPFDTGYELMGCGLYKGTDFPGTAVKMMDLYKLVEQPEESLSGHSCYVYSGQLNHEAFEREMKLNRQGAGEALDRLVEVAKSNMLWARVHFSKTDLILRRCEMGNAPGKPSMIAEFDKVKINLELADDQFVYKLPAGASAQDITDQILKLRQRQGAE
jgi:outer membrane lipoprotein-sorting protein